MLFLRNLRLLFAEAEQNLCEHIFIKEAIMRLTFHGAARTVTGSRHLLEINGHRVLLECGLYQGRRKDTYERNRRCGFDPRSIDAVLLSHAHIDHSGNLPLLIKHGYQGPVYATSATAHLANIMLLDSGHIQEEDAHYLNKKRRRKGLPPVEPLYTIEDAARVSEHFVGVPYNFTFEVVPGVRAKFVDAGHILGSAAIVLDLEEKGRKVRLWFSGDIGRRHIPILRDPVLPDHADYLLMESTYGDKPHRDVQAAFEELHNVVRRTVERGGKVIIPAFAVGRTQELVYALHRMIESGDIPDIPIIVDSPLAVNASEIYHAHPECYNAEARQMLLRGDDVLGFGRVAYIRSVDESKALNDRHDPMVIISASGMAETGRILHHLKNNIENPRNTVLIVSWQAPYTLGRRLADREPQVRIFGETYQVRAEVATINGFSAHAGRNGLLRYARRLKGQARRVFIVHGEPRGALPLIEALHSEGMKVSYPQPHEHVDL